MRASTLRALPRGVIALGFVSLFMDVSSEMIHGLLPLYLTSVLGLGAMALGWMEGTAEAAAAVLRVFSGSLSDWSGRRKPLVVAGYGLAALAKPIFPLASGAAEVFAARLLDRMGKGLRGAPRDALIADLTPAPLLGAAYGLRQAMDTAGAFAGPALAMSGMALTQGNYRAVFWMAAAPALLSVCCAAFGVRDAAPARQTAPRLPRGEGLSQLGRAYWATLGVLALLSLARCSEAFLMLKASSVGLVPAWTPAVLLLMNLAYSLSAYPFGCLSDHMDRRGLLAAGTLLLLSAHAVLASSRSITPVLVGCGLWGLHLGATQGILSALVAASAPPSCRGTAFGLFHLVSAGALLAANGLAGSLWQWHGPEATFLAGALFCLLALPGVLRWLPRGV
jgi:MFS family permease